MTLLWLPAARRVVHDSGLAFTDPGEPKGVLHTTETPGRPSYDGWSVHPHLTVVPVPRVRVDVDQHIPFNHAGMALRNLPGGVQTNRDRAYQVELVGTCEKGGKAHKAGAYYWPDADDKVLVSLWDRVIKPMSTGLNIPQRTLAYQNYPASYGDPRPTGRTNIVRLSGPAWDAYSGWCGHQHVPENIHGDPGAFPWGRMLRAVQARDEASRATQRPHVLDRVLRPGDKDRRVAGKVVAPGHITALQKRLMALGYRLPKYGADGDYGDETREAVDQLKTKLRLNRNGLVGKGTCKGLGWTWAG